MIINISRKVAITCLMLISSITFYACSCSCMESQSVVPGQVMKKANQFLISKVGRDYFDKNIKPDMQETKKIQGQYQMVYSFKIPDKPYVDTKIKFSVDSTGEIINKENIVGIPDCLSSPGKCEFNINEEQAKQIAQKNNFPEGIKDWKVEFKWEPEKNQYVWSILSTLQQSQGSFGFRGSGEIMLIDPNNGEIISRKPWHVM